MLHPHPSPPPPIRLPPFRHSPWPLRSTAMTSHSTRLLTATCTHAKDKKKVAPRWLRPKCLTHSKNCPGESWVPSTMKQQKYRTRRTLGVDSEAVCWSPVKESSYFPSHTNTKIEPQDRSQGPPLPMLVDSLGSWASKVCSCRCLPSSPWHCSRVPIAEDLMWALPDSR